MKTIKSKCAALFSALMFLLLLPMAAVADDFAPISPLPLAKNAAPKLLNTPEWLDGVAWRATQVQMNVLIGSHDYDALDKVARDWRAAYQAKKISAETYLNNMAAMAPTQAGVGMLDDMLAWTKARPSSYAAWYALGVQYSTISFDQRGRKFASQTTPEQWAEMAKYADLAHAAFVRSLSLTPDPLPTYSQLIKLAALVKRPAPGAAPMMERVSMEMKQKPFCPAAGSAGADFKTAWAEEIYYLCLARKADPDATLPFRNLVSFNIPRWGVGYAILQQLYDELAADHRTAPLQLGMMKAYVLAAEASDVAESGRNAHLASQLYEQAFDAAPIGENMKHLYSAMFQEWKQAKNLDQAIRLANRALAVRKSEWQAYYDGGLIYQEKGNLQKYMEYQIAAANLGVREAQNNVGYYYMVGQRGLPRDLREAKAWFTLSADQGFEHAREKLAVVDAMIAKEKK
ncbi:MAG TPA: DUF4034 domain-containing protein [Burkholderiales bacterium]|nr:DUF4034 domain-containing protein [Burkholderiales bacterium]